MVAQPGRWGELPPPLAAGDSLDSLSTAEISTPLRDQELALPSLAYWEGLIHVSARRAGTPVEGHGYMELTGYGAALEGLESRPLP